MRKIVAGLHISLDGIVEMAGDVMGGFFSPELVQAIGTLMGAQDAMLLGRVTYEEFAGYWPHQTGELADTMGDTMKYVVSDTLENPGWRNARIVKGDVVAEVSELKRQEGKNIGMTGSATLVASLLRAGLVDELHLFFFPLVLGSGKRLFADGSTVPLHLLDSHILPKGVVYSKYARV